MGVRRFLILALFAAACSNHGPSPAAPAKGFFLSQKAWCTIEKGGAQLADDDQYGEIYFFKNSNQLVVATADLNEKFQQLQWNERGLLKTKKTQSATFRADNQSLYFKVGDNDETMSSYQIVQRKINDQTVKCFELTFNDTVHCPCTVAEAQ